MTFCDQTVMVLIRQRWLWPDSDNCDNCD